MAAVASHPLQIVGGEQETEMLNVITKTHDKDRANNTKTNEKPKK